MTMGGMEGFGFLGQPETPTAEGFEALPGATLTAAQGDFAEAIEYGLTPDQAQIIFGLTERGDERGQNLLDLALANPDIAKLSPEAFQLIATLQTDENLNVYMMQRLTPLSAFANWLATKDGTGWLEGIQDLPQWKQEDMFQARDYLTSPGGRPSPNYAIPFGEYYGVKSGLERTGQPVMFANPWKPTAKQLFPAGAAVSPRERAMVQYRRQQQEFRQLPRPGDTPELTEEQIQEETRMFRRFPTLFRTFKDAPEEERAEGFMPFVQADPERRVSFEERMAERTRPRRTRPIRFARL